MSKFSSRFKVFAVDRMRAQGAEIREWANSDNPLLAQTCKEIIEASK